MNTTTAQQPTGRRPPALGVFRLLVILALVIGVAARSISAAPVTEPAGGDQPIPVHGQAATPISADEPTPTETAFEPASEVGISVEFYMPREQQVMTDKVSVVAYFSGNDGQVNGTVQFAVCGPAVTPCTASEATPLGTPRSFAGVPVQSSDFTPADPNATGTYCFLVDYQPAPGSPYQPTAFSDSSACVTFKLPSLTIVLAGKDDGAATNGGHLVDFGVVSPRGTAPTTNGVTVIQSATGATYTADNSLRVTVKAEGSAWIGTCYVSDSGSTNLDLAWKLGAGATTPFAVDAVGGQGCVPGAPIGTSEGLYIYDLSLTVGWNDSPGPTSSTIVFGVTAP